MPQKLAKDSKKSLRPKTILDRLFSRIEHFAYTHSFSVILVSLVVAGASLWVTLERLTFKTGRGDLVAKNLPYVERHEKFRDEFQDFDGMIVVVEGEEPEQKKNFVEALADKIKSHPAVFSDVFYKVDTAYFKDKALLFLSQQDLVDLVGKIEEHKQFLDDVNASPGLNQLLRSINSEISSGMVDTLMSGFIGTDDEQKDETAGLSLLTALLKQMVAHLKEGAFYRSPWSSFFAGEQDSLKEEGYLVSGENDLMFILVTPREDETVFTGYRESIEFARKLVNETLENHPQIRVGITGEDVIASDEMITTQVDVKKATLMALIGVSLLFIVAFRGIVKPLMAVFCLVVAIGWSMGFTTLTVGHLNILSVVFTTILIGLGIDFGIHILERYKEERQAGRDIPSSLQITVEGTGRGNFAGAITTAMAFGAMTLTDFIGISELGWIAAWGILFCMIAMILLLPALLAVEEKWRKTEYDRPTHPVENKQWMKNLYDHYYIIIFISFFLVGLSALSLRDLAFDYNLLKLQAKNTEAVEYEIKILESAKRSAWSAAMIADTIEEAQKKLTAVKALPTVGEAESILSLIPKNQQEKIDFIQNASPVFADLQVDEAEPAFFLKSLVRTMKKIQFKIRSKEEDGKPADAVQEAGLWVKNFMDQLSTVEPKTAQKRLKHFSEKLFADYRTKIADLRNSANPSPVKIKELPQEMQERFISNKGRFLISIFPNVDIWDLEQREQFLSQLRQVDPDVVGNAVHMFESSRLMKDGYVHGGIYAMAAIIVFVLLSFRNLKTTLFIFLPVIVGSFWTIGIMDLLEVQFNLANLVILPLILGIGVVNGIHIIHRFREEEDKSVPVLSKSTGQAVILSSLTTMVGFGSMMVADHQGIFSLGLVLTLGVGSCLVASITIVPAFLRLASVKGWKI
ncbi:MAG: transporter [Nitrospinaceae bacterium]|nr:MAG: transporter [Nitrospinaceae bacterium]